MKICPNCKKEYDDRMAFCAGCGSRLVDMQPTPQQPQQPVQTVSFCMHCGNKMNSNSAFCAVCGTPTKMANNPVNNMSGQNVAVNDYIDRIKNNESLSGFVENIKNYVLNPAKALNDLVEKDNIAATAIPLAALFLSMLIFFLCPTAQILNDLWYGLELALPIAFILTLAFVLIPFVTIFATAKVMGKACDAKGLLSAASMNVCFLVPILVLGGLVSLIEFWDFGLTAWVIVFVICIFVKIFLSVSMLNQIAGNVLDSIIPFGVSTGIATVLNAIVLSICCSILADIIEKIISNLLFSSLW